MAFTRSLSILKLTVIISTITVIINISNIKAAQNETGTVNYSDVSDGGAESNDSHHGNSSHPDQGKHTDEHDGGHGVHLAKWNFGYVMDPLIITVYALFVGLAKVGE